ncbi:MAG TPA: MFS transporter [Candidatus Binatia bacterium]|nr:MFS transporter [Candidatus Binatia bacterium]
MAAGEPAAARDAAAPAPPTRVRHAVVGMTLAMVAVAYLDRVCIATAAPAIRADLALSDSEMGLVFSAFTIAYAVFEVPGGWFADRYGARLALTRVVLWWSAMTAITGAAWSFASLFVVRLLFGMGEAGAFPATARVYARWLPGAIHGRSFGLLIMAGALAGAATQPLVVALLARTSWHVAFAIFGAVGVVWATAWWIWFRDDPREHPGVNRAELALLPSLASEAGAEGPGLRGAGPRSGAVSPHAIPWAALLRHRTLAFLCAMYASAIYGWYFYLTWLPTYLLQVRGFDLKQVGWLAALPLLSIGVGVWAGGAASDALSRRLGSRRGRRTPGLIGFPLAAAAVVGAVRTPDALTAALLLGAAAGLAALGVAPAWAVTLEIGGRNAGVVSGAMNTFGNLGGALSPIVIGMSVDRWGAWDTPLLSVAAFYLVAAACWLAVDPAQRIEDGTAVG